MWFTDVRGLALVHLVTLPFRTRVSLQLQIIALRHQLAIEQPPETRPSMEPADRLFLGLAVQDLSYDQKVCRRGRQ